MKFRNIEILEKDLNKKGDLFGRLMSDLFHTLGYDEPRLNIHKSGRELDLYSFHRTEKKIAIAECKAHKETIGGADINKFVGVIDAEKIKVEKDKKLIGYNVIGYFISASGFKETAIEQENELGNNRAILIKPEKVVEELIRGRVLISIEKAISSLAILAAHLSIVDHVDLLAYDKGWVWAFFYSNSQGQKTSHFALVHAEGKPLIKSLAEEIISIDQELNKIFEGLILLNKDDPADNIVQRLKETEQKYFKYLENELGEIQFEGLPTDKEAGSVKVKLENIFVPLYLTQSQQKEKKVDINLDEIQREGIGDILSKKSRLAILAKPGGGKSTLIKRIAIAYAFPERRNLINDKLPDNKWFPIFLRCRELGEKVTLSITEIINSIPARAEINSCNHYFSILVSQALQNGNALLLIDGLDEITEDRNRITFVNQLRTFVATYPTINIIVTSREAGFRVVADFLATYCENYSVSNLIDPEIIELCLKWHKAIIDESENTIKDANKLSELILKDNRIKVLAENPLLLTTLLFVKRWAGYLPTKRSVLYQEMIKLLLVTWNVEGHEILDIEEAEPQLAFVAYWMTKNGKQTITAEELNQCLIDARKQLPEILGYTRVSPSEFIKRVESRSSLLIMTGHQRIATGHISAIYEFLHLSFQEYLTAKAIVKRFIIHSDSGKSALDIIRPNFNNQIWKEVIPLTAVLLERDSKELIENLISELQKEISEVSEVRVFESLIITLLGNCLANEVQISPDLLNVAIEWFAKTSSAAGQEDVIKIILKNKFGTTLRKRILECFIDKYEDKYAFSLGSNLTIVYEEDFFQCSSECIILNEILTSLKSEVKEKHVIAILTMMHFAFYRMPISKLDVDSEITLKTIFSIMLDLLKSNDSHYHFCVSWCIAWSCESKIFNYDLQLPFVTSLTKLWVKSNPYNMHRAISWALKQMLTPTINKDELSSIKNLETTIKKYVQNPSCEFDKETAIYLGSLIGIEFETKEFLDIKNKFLSHQPKEK